MPTELETQVQPVIDALAAYLAGGHLRSIKEGLTNWEIRFLDDIIGALENRDIGPDRSVNSGKTLAEIFDRLYLGRDA